MEIFTDLSMEDYLADNGIGSSQLKLILSSPADFKEALSQKSADTNATILGTGIHAAILEPDLFKRDYALQPEYWGPKNQGEGYRKWKQFKLENKGRHCFDFKDACLLNKIMSRTKESDVLKKILTNGQPEVTAFCEQGGHRFKARTDWYASDGVLWDVKTTCCDMSDESLEKEVFKFGYHFQAAHHLWVLRAAGADVHGFGWIFVATKTPSAHVLPRRCSDELLKAGKLDHKYARELLAECTKANDWPGYSDEISEITLPKFARKDYEL